MRGTILITVTALSSSLLTVLLFSAYRGDRLPTAFGQSAAAGNGVVLATAMNQGGGESFAFVYNLASQTLATYAIRGNSGLQLRGIRRLTWDFQVQELLDGKHRPVKEVKAMLKRTPTPLPGKTP